MTSITIATSLRSGVSFVPIGDVPADRGDPDYVEGAITFTVDGAELFGVALWDDVDWLWPLVVRALDDYRQHGTGRCSFPDQPILFSAERVRRAGHTLLQVSDGQNLRRSVVVPTAELFSAVARAGKEFFVELERVLSASGASVGSPATEAVLDGWLREPPDGPVP